jgi:hypothetical protein
MLQKLKIHLQGGKPTFHEKPVIFKYENFTFKTNKQEIKINEVQYQKMSNHIDYSETPF